MYSLYEALSTLNYDKRVPILGKLSKIKDYKKSEDKRGIFKT